MMILSKIFGNLSFNSTINLIRLKNSNLKLFKSKLFMTFLVTIVLASSMLTNVAWAYKDGEFPGIGSYAKWQEANVYFNKAVPLNNLAEEEALYKKAIEIYPFDAGFWINYAYSTNNKQERIRRFLEAARLNPDDCSGYQGAAYEYEHMGQYEKAIEYWKKAIAIKSNDSGFYVSLATCLEAKNQTQEAIDQLLEGYKATKSLDILYDIGVGYYKLHNYDMAKSYINQCLKIRPGDKLFLESLNTINKEIK